VTDEEWAGRYFTSGAWSNSPYDDLRAARALVRDRLDAELEELLDQQDRPPCGVSAECPEHGLEQCETRARWIGRTFKGGKEIERFLSCDWHHDLFIEMPVPDEQYVWTEL